MTKKFWRRAGTTCVGLLTPFSAQAAGTPKPIFQCSFGAKSVSVVAVGKDLIYTFGTAAKPEMSIVGSAQRGNVFYSGPASFGTLTYDLQLRFANGRISYVLTESGLTDDFNRNRPGEMKLTVLDGDRRIARSVCKSGSGFSNIDLIDSMPEDTVVLDD